MKLPEMDQKSFLTSPSYHGESRSGVEEDPSDSPGRFPFYSPRSGRSPIKVDVLRTWSPPESLTVRSAIWFFHHAWAVILPEDFVWMFSEPDLLQQVLPMGVNTSFALSLLAWSSDASISSISSNVCDHNVSFPDSSRVKCISKEYTWQDFWTKLM